MNVYEFINLFNDDRISIFEAESGHFKKHGLKYGKYAAGAAAAYGGVKLAQHLGRKTGFKLAQRLKKRKQCKDQFPNDPEKYKACMKV